VIIKRNVISVRGFVYRATTVGFISAAVRSVFLTKSDEEASVKRG
jgi:hypothetical protein